MHIPKWSLFYDFHTMPACPDVGKYFDVEAFVAHLKACGVDFVVFPARCNLGMAYYDTKVGIRHPSLDYDLLGRLTACCKKNGIAISAYINVGLSHEEGSRNRGWLKLMPEGEVYSADKMNSFFRLMCYNTGYAEHLLEMVREVVTNYPVDGLFLDCLHQKPCVGAECVREMKERGMDWNDRRQQEQFAHESQVRICRRISEAARSVRDDLLLYFNGVAFEEQADIGTYVEYECLPTGGWGYEMLPYFARYLRNLGKPVLNMTGRFHESWGDFGGIRTEASLEYDLLYGIANCLPPTIGDHYHPRGDANPAVNALVRKLYTRLRKLEPWMDGATALTDMAVVFPRGFHSCHMEEFVPAVYSVSGATRMLCEEKQQFDVLTGNLDLSGYRLLILPDDVKVDDKLKQKLRAHLDAGGSIIASAKSGLDLEGKDFVFPEWGVSFEGESPHDPAFIRVGEAMNEAFPDMPVAMYDRGITMGANDGTEAAATIVTPFYNQQWDGEHGFVYLPPDAETNSPALTFTGQVAHFSHPLFISYHRHAQVPMRQLLANVLRRMLPEPLVKAEKLPSFARLTVTVQARRRMVHLLAYVPERRGDKIDMIEEPITLRDVKVALRLDGRPPAKVYLAPGGEQLPFVIADGYIQVTVPEAAGYALIVFEEP